ncbi:MAG TPA: hypothetical protein VGD74_00550 [Vulgatibacter sp.]
MARLTTGLLLILAGIALAAWNAPRLEGFVHRSPQHAAPAPRPVEPRPQVEGGRSPAVDPEVDEGKAQPPGREDPNEFYKKAPRKPRQLRRIHAALPVAEPLRA